MVTKYDAFEIMYETQGPVKPADIAKRLGKNYHAVYYLLSELEKDSLIEKTKHGFQVKTNEKTKLLYSIIYYCLRNNINYGFLLDINLVRFIRKAANKREATISDFKLNPRTFQRYVQMLNKYGLLLTLSKKPLKIRIFHCALINNLMLYFNIKYNEEKKVISYLKEIEKELALYKKLRRKNEAGLRKVIDEFEILFIHHSLTLEGNPITLPDTIKILKDKIIPKNLRSEDVDEVKNYQTAVLQMLKDSQHKNPLTLQTILNYHSLVMQHRPEIAGKIREIEVYIRGNPYFKTAKPEEIKEKLDGLLNKYNKFMVKKPPLKEVFDFAAYFHNEFQYIHPFEDGNSRIARLITFHLLQHKDIPILDIPLGLLDEYLSDTKGSKIRNDKELFETLQKIVLYNIKKINERLAA